MDRPKFVYVVLIIKFAVTSSSGFDCRTEDSSLDSYKYKNFTEVNCGCDSANLCLRKCCLPGYYLTKGYCRRDDSGILSNRTKFEVPIYKDMVNYVDTRNIKQFIAGTMNCNFYAIIINETLGEFPYVQDDKRLYILPEKRFVNQDEFCVDHYERGSYSGFAAFVCFPSVIVEQRVKQIGMIISIPFLLATIIVYCLLPERNLHMKTLMCYVTNLMFAYILLVTIQLGHAFSDTSCSIIGFLCLFLFTSSIFWMNIICLDIFLTFSGYFGIQGNKHKENRRLFYYSIYGLLAPCALIFTTFMVNKYGDPSKNYHPSIGNGICFLKDGLPYLLYFHGPVGALLCANVVLFTLTALKIRQAKKETKVLKKGENRKSNENDKKRFNLYIKLLLAMGINWAMETISWACEQYTDIPKAIWYLTDFCNALYGVVIFVLFAWKKRHWKILKKKSIRLIAEPPQNHHKTSSSSPGQTDQTIVTHTRCT